MVYNYRIYFLFSISVCTRLHSYGRNSLISTICIEIDLDRKTHQFLIEPLSGHLHLKTMLMSRFVSFYKGLVDSPILTVRFLARLAEKDMRTVMGKTLHYLLGECNCEQLEDLTPHIVKKRLVYKIATHDQTWQVAFAQELQGIRNEDATVQGYTNREIITIFYHVCTE